MASEKEQMWKSLGTLILIGVIGYQLYDYYNKRQDEINESRNLKQEQVYNLSKTKFYFTKNVENGSELHMALRPFSNLTEIQRDKILKSCEGELVGTEATVQEIEKSDNGENLYKIRTISIIGIDFTLIVYPIDYKNEEYIMSLRKGSRIKILGYIYKNNGSRLVINPCIIIDNQDREIADKEAIPKKAPKPLIFDHCDYIYNVPVICGDIPFNGYKQNDCISALMRDDFDNVCKKMKRGKKYYFEYNIYREDIDGEPTEKPYENITKIFLK